MITLTMQLPGVLYSLIFGLVLIAFQTNAQTDFPNLSLPHQPGTIIIKTRLPLPEGNKAGLTSRLSNSTLLRNNIQNLRPTLPWIAKSISSGRITSHPLANIYTLRISADADLEEIILELQANEEILYAEPYYLYKPMVIPNDPGVGSQYYLDQIRAFDAWNIEQGDTTITIAMLDTGVDYLHEEMTENIQYNYNDPINGVDDDNDGLIDNYFGWDIADRDNVPLPDADAHGSTVAGVSSATVNNNIGIAGLGYHTRILPIKIFTSSSNLFLNGYEAIALAADLGCQVINLSWGQAGAYSAFGEDVIRYAVLEKDAAVIASGGNTNGQLDFYPASYPYVLSVGATDESGGRAKWATYSPYMDLMAPGDNIYTINNNNKYVSSTGTSYSSPLVAAAVALVRARFPELNAQQAMEKVRVNTDNIIEGEGGVWDDYIGKGRLNVYKALTDITSPSIRLTDFTYSNGLAQSAYFKDTLSLALEFQNLLYASSNVRVTMSSESPYVDFSDNEFQLPALQTLQKTNKKTTLRLSPDTPPDERILIKFTYTSGAYTDQEYIEFTTSPSWATLDNDKIQFSFASDGNLGYARNLKQDGVGLRYNDQQMLDNIGLMIRSENIIMDNIPVRQSQHAREQDFGSLINLRPSNNSIADQYYVSTFSTEEDGTPILPLKVEQKIFSWDSLGAVVLEYLITNTGDSSLTNFQPAVYADFDINEPTTNRLSLTADGKIQYTTDDGGELFGGFEILSENDGFLTGLDKRNLSGNASDMPPYLSDEEKKSFFLKNDSEAGSEGTGNDVAGLVGFQPSTLDAGQQMRFAVTLSADSSLAGLEALHELIRQQYAAFRSNPPIGLIAQFCRGEDAYINPEGALTRIFADPEATNLLFEGDEYIIPNVQEQLVLYGININGGIQSDIYRILVIPADLNTDFAMSSDLVLLDETNNTKVDFMDESENASQWNWTFSNGYFSDKANPSINFSTPGEYTITLTSGNELGCSGTKTKNIIVANRNVRIANQTLADCPGTAFLINPSDADSIHVYADPQQSQLLYQGRSFQTGSVFNDTSFYVTNLDGPYESLPAEYSIDISEITASFLAIPDTLDLSNPYLLRLIAKDKNASFYQWELDDGSNSTVILSTDTEYLLDYSQLTDFTISLMAVNGTGCSVNEEQEFIRSGSPLPIVSTTMVCSGDQAIIRPQEDGVYHFYLDENLGTLLGKGRSFSIPELTRDTSIYVVGINNLIESEPVAAEIMVSFPEADFTFSHNPLNLTVTPVVRLTDVSSGSIITSVWQVDGEVLGQGTTFDFEPEAAGDYQITLVTENASGCVAEFTQNLQVVLVTGTNSSVVTGAPFPNPVRGELTIPGSSALLQLIQLDGRLVSECEACTSITVAQEKSGSYLLRVIRKESSQTYLIRVE